MTAFAGGSWTTLYLDVVSNEQVYKSLADIDTLPTHLRHDAAMKMAQTWLEHFKIEK